MGGRLLKHQAAPEKPPEHGQKESLEGKEKKFKSPPLASTSPEGCIHTPAEQKVAQVTTHTVWGEVEVLKGYMSPLENIACSYVFVWKEEEGKKTTSKVGPFFRLAIKGTFWHGSA